MLLVDAAFNNNTWGVQTEVTHSEGFFVIFLTIYICCAAAANQSILSFPPTPARAAQANLWLVCSIHPV